MQIDITEFFRNAAPRDYSASVAEIGRDAGAVTWGHAVEDSEEYPLLSDDDAREAFRAFIRSSGGWDDEEISRWSDRELNALCIQWVSGDIRECDIGPDSTDEEWEECRARQETGACPSQIWRDDAGRVWFDLEC